MLQQGDSTYYGHRLDQCTIEDCYYQAMESCNFHQLRKDVDDFNAQNRWKKRGLAVVPTKFGISYAETFLNQVYHIDLYTCIHSFSYVALAYMYLKLKY